MSHELWNASIILILLGGVAAAASVLLRMVSHRGLPYREQAEARVVDIVAVPREGESSLSEYHNRLAAVFEFYADGRPVKVTDPADTYPCPYHLNDRVWLSYDPEHPEHFQIFRRNKWQILSFQCKVLGTLLVLGGCAIFLFYAIRAGA